MTETKSRDENGLRDFDALWDYQKVAETEKKFRSVLEESEGTADREYLGELRTQIARTRGLQKDYAGAHSLLDEVEQGVRPEDRVVRVRLLLERGRTFNAEGKKAEAEPLFIQAWEEAKAIPHEVFAVDAAHMVAYAAHGVDAKKAHDWNLRAVAYAETAKTPRARSWRATLYNNIGWTYHDDQKKYPEALDAFQKALEVQREFKRPQGIRVARWCVARCLRSLNRVEEALSIQQDLLAEYEREGIEEQGFTSEEMGECLLALGRDAEAKPHFVKAYGLLHKVGWVADSYPDRIARLKKLAGAE